MTVVLLLTPGCGDGNSSVAADTSASVDAHNQDLVGSDTPAAEDAAEATDGAGPDDSEDADAPDGTSPDGVAFIVFGSSQGTRVPLTGATIAFDGPDGTRQEHLSDESGRVFIAGVDWSLGTAAVTAYKEGHALASWVNMDESVTSGPHLFDGAIPLDLTPREQTEPQTITVSGEVSGIADMAHVTTVAALQGDVSSAWFSSLTNKTSFSFTAPSGEPLQVLALETEFAAYDATGFRKPVHAVAMRALEGSESDLGAIGIDFGADAVPTQTAVMTTRLPTRPESPVREHRASCGVNDINQDMGHGWATEMRWSAEGDSFDTTFLWFEPTGTGVIRTYCQVTNASGRVISYIDIESYPTTTELGVLPDTPQWELPTNTQQPSPLHSPFAWSTSDPEAETAIVNVNNMWQVRSSAAPGTITIPQPPTGADTVSLLGTEPVGAIVMVGVAAYSGQLPRWQRFGSSSVIAVRP